MNYKKVYDQLIAKRRTTPINRKDGDCEYHHIVPKCMGGTNEPENLISLTTKEHIFAHIVLSMAYPKNKKLLYAAQFMTDRFHLTSRIAAQIRLKAYKAQKGKHVSAETRRKISEARRGKPSWNKGKHLSEETRRKISEARKGQTSFWKGKHHSEETKQKISKTVSISCKGERNGMYGKHHSEEAKRKLRGRIISDETRQKMREAWKRRKEKAQE